MSLVLPAPLSVDFGTSTPIRPIAEDDGGPIAAAVTAPLLLSLASPPSAISRLSPLASADFPGVSRRSSLNPPPALSSGSSSSPATTNNPLRRRSHHQRTDTGGH